ncbi:FAD-dependent oxidoreductase [Pseudonocardia sp. TRM90224]|uniref:FAD-dependent oxidoreductase n=1 Tax=Pseudonocardia sp. TRM90224 TaxID=2812678 RepID=UPI001E2A5325|nr:FAD-dependent monooxygenase [Pseudonocardia sp. TRM90224]
MPEEPVLRSYDGPPEQGRHAVVIGSGMAGLLAARVATEHFEQVTVIDRDRFPERPDHRKGTPQSHHAHGLLPRGHEIVHGLFPGIGDDLRAAGATVAKGVGAVVVSPAGPLPALPSPGEFVMFSRFLLEWTIRRRLAALPQVRFLQGADVVGLEADGAGVSGVRLRHRGDADGPDVVPADLVIDCSGRSSKAPDWLRELGCGDVPEDVVNTGLSYASRFFERPAGFPDEWLSVLINGRSPDNPRAGLLLCVENNLWHVTVGQVLGDRLPAEGAGAPDDAAFLRMAGELADPTIYEAIRVAKPVSPIRGYRTPTNRLRRFEKLKRMPTGFVVTGDAACAFNPIYGQGMTVAAMDALVLAEALRRSEGGRSADFAQAFQADLAKNVAAPWFVATSEDLRWADVRMTGARLGLVAPIGRRYMDLLLRAAVHDPELTAVYLGIIFMLAPPKSAVAPWIIARIVRSLFSRRLRQPLQEYALSAEGLAAVRKLPDAVVPA